MPVLILWLLLLASPAYAQIEECAVYRDTINEIVDNKPLSDAPNYNPADRFTNLGETFRCFSVYAAGVERLNRIAFSELVRRFESSRTDKQSGSSANGTGSTSVVAQGPAAKVLSVAAEYGALTQSVNGQVVTVRGNLAGLPSALVRHNVFPYCVGPDRTNGYCVGNSLLGLLRRASFAVSFDTTRGNEVTGTVAAGAGAAAAQPVTFTANRREISAISARVELWNRRDTTSSEFATQFAARVPGALNQASADLLATAGNFSDAIMERPEYAMWQMKHRAAFAAARRDRNRAMLVAALNSALAELVPIARAAVPDLQTRADSTLAAYSRFFLAQDALIDTLAVKKVVTLEYTNNRPASQPTTSNVRVILDWPMNLQTKVVANGSVTIYDTLPADRAPDVAHYRDAQVAVQLEHALGRNPIVGPAIFSLAGYYQYQHSPSLLEIDPANPIPGVTFVGLPDGAKTVFASKGSIGLFQAKLALAPEGSSMKIPVSVTYSNRTELIDKPAWRGQVGISYDFDSLFAGLGAR
jgi:hypothetical protein